MLKLLVLKAQSWNVTPPNEAKVGDFLANAIAKTSLPLI